MQPSGTSVDGVKVGLDSYYVHDTYSGVLMGVPSADMMIDAAKCTAEDIWGKGRPTLVVPPKRTPILKPDGTPRVCTWPGYTGKPLESLPDRVMMAWLSCFTPPEGTDFDGSHLFVIWFDDQDATDPVLMALKHVNEAGGWWKNAQGWSI